jgi:hypothetical protein
MPSIAELQSIATMEAMASGRPVIAADAMALPHLVHDGDNGYLFPPDDVDAFADRLNRVLTADEAELERLSENSLYLIQAHDIQRTLKIFEDLYVGELANTSDDNLPEYNLPIGRLSPNLHQQILSFRSRAEALAERVEEAGDSLKDRIEDYRDDVREKFYEARRDVRVAARKVRAAVKRARKRVRRER